ncbi:CgeB family protein [Sporomusa sphaeroides]|uniref:CgeB family protein n=1 Tax=Sporomusa sphaeroides TaxID=47679 RepID=UPI002C6DFC23|nr:glycosyltransferase [Sporomusa sphaeroides]HML34143.1 glycosyltransferase [Sporomusa sphaeroides]
MLIIGQDYFHYMNSLVKACEMLGHEVLKVVSQEFKKQKENYWKMRAVKLGMKSIEAKYYKKMNLQFLKTAEEFKPDICIFINGKDITQDFLAYLKERQIRTRLFMIDSIQTGVFRPFLKNLPYYDRIFSYEPSDLEFLSDKHPDVNYLFVGYDSSIFYPLQEIRQEEYDICFVGSLYPSRLEILEKIASYAHSHNKKMIVHTTNRYPQKYCWHLPRNFFRRLRFKVKYAYLDKNIIDVPLYNEELSKIYQQSRICINMHAGKNNRLHTGPNPRSFEILGCRAFQLIDAGHMDYTYLENKRHLVEYRDTKELCENIDYYLNHDEERETIATTGYLWAKEKYTMQESVRKLLE